ncbi:hypothetical protein [Archangium sp.]|jgi:hypothetical protein|uniref:hypothetical protein n=1 Tax=Archangium sp. TaxID=1872627 RepID=UPI00389A98A8
MPSQEIRLSLQQRRAASSLLILLANIGIGGCFEAGNCTPADNTHSCCVKNNPMNPGACDAMEEAEGVAFRVVKSTAKPPILGGKVALTAAAALVLHDVDSFQAARADIEKILVDCARYAEEELNRRRLGGKKPERSDCDQEIGKKPNGDPITQAMLWGLEKHKEARECVDRALTQLIPTQFSLEQRYRFDPATGQKSLVSKEARDKLVRQGRAKELEGTLEPDVVIHSGDPLQAWAVYDFKFPCPETNLPTWTKYPKGHPYQGRTQGEMYRRALGRSPSRVTPLDGVIPDSLW